MYAKVTGTTVDKFPYTKVDLRADNPNVSFGKNTTLDDVAQYGVVAVTQQADPVFDPATEYLVQGIPTLSGPNWVVTQMVIGMTQQEIDDTAAQTARQEDLAAIKADAQVLALLKARPDQINTYMDNNFTDLAGAREIQKIIARAVAVLAQTLLK